MSRTECHGYAERCPIGKLGSRGGVVRRKHKSKRGGKKRLGEKKGKERKKETPARDSAPNPTQKKKTGFLAIFLVYKTAADQEDQPRGH